MVAPVATVALAPSVGRAAAPAAAVGRAAARNRCRARRLIRIRCLACRTTAAAVLRPDILWIIRGGGRVQLLESFRARKAGGPLAAVGARRAACIPASSTRAAAQGARMRGPGSSRSVRHEGRCRHHWYRRNRRHGSDLSRRRHASAAAPPELAKHLGGIEDDIASRRATVCSSEKGDSIHGGSHNTKRRRRSGRSRILR